METSPELQKARPYSAGTASTRPLKILICTCAWGTFPIPLTPPRRVGERRFPRGHWTACAILQLLFQNSEGKDFSEENPVLQEHQLHLLLQRPSDIQADWRPTVLCLAKRFMGSGLFKEDKPLPVKGNVC
ncbi:C-C motif chemokine 1 isoform X1 [Bubalus kerabau]|uniref:C-C motif chemokine 1 isoform X1 n=1 Tax=Bubalus carabanensis TaxID=3119969 RepID=UPI00244EEDEA|nr:C-C motif chemokine 1 isoform X1 [Bubalus carabanensis]